MKRALMWCLLGLVLFGGATWSQAQTDETEKAVAALEQQWLLALKTSNPDLLAPLLADSLVFTSAGGKVIAKAETLAGVKSEKWASAEYYYVKVGVYGDTAIATGGFKGKGTDGFDANERWTDTWVKMPNGKWQCVAAHSSAVNPIRTRYRPVTGRGYCRWAVGSIANRNHSRRHRQSRAANLGTMA